MTLFQTIKSDQLQARKNKDIVKASLLTTLIGEIQTQLKSSNKKEDEIVLNTILKFIKSAKQSLDIKYTDLVKQELSILDTYTPKMLSDSEVDSIIKENIENNANFGSIMKVFSTQYKGQYDAKILSVKVKEHFK